MRAGVVRDGAAVASGVRGLGADLVLLDACLPGAPTLAVLRAVASLSVVPRVIVLAPSEPGMEVSVWLRAGASAVLLRQAPAEVIEAVTCGAAVHSAGAARQLFGQSQRRSSAHEALGRLTHRERQVLVLVTQGRSNRQIADRLRMSEGTVKGHVSRMMAKIGADNRVQAALVGYEAGLVGRESDGRSAGEPGGAPPSRGP